MIASFRFTAKQGRKCSLMFTEKIEAEKNCKEKLLFIDTIIFDNGT
jgi:hypothetical protein